MLSVFIVDDEEIVRSALKHILDEDFPASLRIRLCRNGLDALRQAEETRPDIVFMDIKMPGISGIETARRLIRLNPRAGVIFLSAYEEFSFAREAISMGAREYLSKPINRRKVLAVFNKVRNELEETAHREDTLIELRNEVLMSRPLIEEHLVFSAILGNRRIGPELFELTDIRNAFDARARVLTVQYRDLALHRDREAVLFPEGVHAELRGMLKQRFSVLVGAPVLDTFTAILFSTASEDIAALEEAFAENEAHDRIYAGLGFETINAEGLHESYLASLEALHRRIIPGMETAAERSVESSPPQGPTPLEKLALPEARARACERAAALVHGHKNPAALPRTIRSGKYLQELIAAESTTELIVRLKEFMKLFQEERGGASEVPRLIRQAREYVDTEYDEEVSLEEAAGRLRVNPTYLSARFKECCGVTFTHYLTRRRMEAAALMLDQSDASIKEIAHRCGFNDANYFSRIFKHWYGRTPSRYRGQSS